MEPFWVVQAIRVVNIYWILKNQKDKRMKNYKRLKGKNLKVDFPDGRAGSSIYIVSLFILHEWTG